MVKTLIRLQAGPSLGLTPGLSLLRFTFESGGETGCPVDCKTTNCIYFRWAEADEDVQDLELAGSKAYYVSATVSCRADHLLS